MIDEVDGKERFIAFLKQLEADCESDNGDWENGSIPAYLSAISAWIEDYSVCPYNDINWDNIDYKTLAIIFHMGKKYE